MRPDLGALSGGRLQTKQEAPPPFDRSVEALATGSL